MFVHDGEPIRKACRRELVGVDAMGERCSASPPCCSSRPENCGGDSIAFPVVTCPWCLNGFMQPLGHGDLQRSGQKEENKDDDVPLWWCSSQSLCFATLRHQWLRQHLHLGGVEWQTMHRKLTSVIHQHSTVCPCREGPVPGSAASSGGCDESRVAQPSMAVVIRPIGSAHSEEEAPVSSPLPGRGEETLFYFVQCFSCDEEIFVG